MSDNHHENWRTSVHLVALASAGLPQMVHANGYSWAEIGARLGVTHQAACQSAAH